MINETIDNKVTDTIEPVCFTNITTRRICSHTSDKAFPAPNSD